MGKSKIKIKLLGGFEIIVDGKAVLSRLQQSKKTRQLLEYLILKQGKSASHEELLANIWGENSSASAATALRTLLHRYRCMVEDNGITGLKNSVLTSRGGYRWNMNLDCTIDVFELERLVKEAGLAKDGETRKRCLAAAVDIYSGPLLPSSEGKSWVVNKSAYYRDLYLNALYALTDILREHESYAEIVQICRRAQDVEPLEERVNAELMYALVQLGRSDDAFTQFQRHDIAGEDRQRSEAMRGLYERMMRLGEQAENDIDRIFNVLADSESFTGAYECDYSVFPEIYQLQRRLLQRYNTTMFLSLVCLADGEERGGIAMERMMSKLHTALKPNLRNGDTVTRYGASQYVVLMPATTYETASAVMERIKTLFYDQFAEPGVTFTYKLKPLELGDDQ